MSAARLPRASTNKPYTVAFASGATASLRVLTAAERREYEALPYEQRRRDWLTGRCAAKQAIADRCDASVDTVQLRRSLGGAPWCELQTAVDRWERLPFALSISHCDGLAIAAAADANTRVGVDIEYAGAASPEHSHYFLAAGEQSQLGRLDATSLWTLKEAAWKALALDEATPFAVLQLDFHRDSARLRGVWLGSAWIAARARLLRFFRSHPLIVAVVTAARSSS